jgi:hypothetical protein
MHARQHADDKRTQERQSCAEDDDDCQNFGWAEIVREKKLGRLTEQIDFSAASVLDHGASLDAVADEAMRRLLAVASGALTFGEIVGEGGEVVSRIGASI